MEKLDPRLAAIIVLLYIRYLPGMILENLRIVGRKHIKNGDSGTV